MDPADYGPGRSQRADRCVRKNVQRTVESRCLRELRHGRTRRPAPFRLGPAEATGRQDAVDPKEREPDLEPATISVVVVALRRWRRVVQCIPRSSVVAYGSTAPVRACSRERWRRSGGDGLDIWRLYASLTPGSGPVTPMSHTTDYAPVRCPMETDASHRDGHAHAVKRRRCRSSPARQCWPLRR